MYPAQRDALAEVFATADDLRRWLGCQYVRARALRRGAVCFTGDELRALVAASPVAGAYVARRVLSPADVRRRQLVLWKGGAP